MRRRPDNLPTTTLPLAVVGALALSLTAAPAQAADVGTPRGAGLGAAPASALRPSTSPPRAAATAAPAAAPAATAHTVAAGDTVSAVAARYGLRTADVLAWNGLTWTSVIRPGQILRLSPSAASTAPPPAAAAPAATHTVRAGDTLWAIARTYGMSVTTLSALNGLGASSVIQPGQQLAIALSAEPAASTTPAPPAAPASPPASASHTIAPGDTLWAIAQQHGTSVSALLAANGLSASSIIYPGQTLRLPDPGALAGLDAEQIANATLVVQVGRQRGVPDRGIAIALATAMVESWMRNLDWGDRDSLGLFQQRPSQGWGTAGQVLDPVRATAVFYGGPGDPNGALSRGLLDIPGWHDMDFSHAAQAVQVSAYPDRYGQWEQQAYAWLSALG